MASERFSFAQDNIRKALRLPWFIILAVIMKIIPRDRRLWVFSRRAGFGDGPYALLCALKRRSPGTRCIWLATNELDLQLASNEGVEVVRRDSVHGLWLCLRAGTGVLTNGFSDLGGPAIWGARVINLWHGAPLKRIGLDRYSRPSGTTQRLLSTTARSFERYWNLHYTCIVAGAPVTASRLGSAMGLSEKTTVTGDPRIDLIDISAQVAREILVKRAGLGDGVGKRFILLAPTWRDGGRSTHVHPCKATVAASLGSNGYLFVRAHPYSDEVGSFAGLPNVYALSSNEYPDITSLLGGFDVLMTDYSSIAIDFSLLHRPMFFAAPDLDEYRKEPGFYESYEEFTGGEWHGDWTSAFFALSELMEESAWKHHKSIENSRILAERFHPYGLNGNSDRVLDFISMNEFPV